MTTTKQAEILFHSALTLGISESELRLLYNLFAKSGSEPYGVAHRDGAEWLFVDDGSLEGLRRVR